MARIIEKKYDIEIGSFDDGEFVTKLMIKQISEKSGGGIEATSTNSSIIYGINRTNKPYKMISSENVYNKTIDSFDSEAISQIHALELASQNIYVNLFSEGYYIKDTNIRITYNYDKTAISDASDYSKYYDQYLNIYINDNKVLSSQYFENNEENLIMKFFNDRIVMLGNIKTDKENDYLYNVLVYDKNGVIKYSLRKDLISKKIITEEKGYVLYSDRNSDSDNNTTIYFAVSECYYDTDCILEDGTVEQDPKTYIYKLDYSKEKIKPIYVETKSNYYS